MEHSLPPDRLLAIIETQSEIAASALDLDAVMTLVVRRARALTGAAAGVVELADGEEMVYHVASGTAEAHLGLRLRRDESLSGLCVRLGEVLHRRDAETDGRVDLDACRRVRAMSMLCVPLEHERRVVGVLKVYDPRPEAFDEADVTTLDLLSVLIAAQMGHSSEFARHRHESRRDPLTGLPNRRAFDERLGADASRLRRHGGALSLALLDLDGFKRLNDTHGHAGGDAVLRAVARRLQQVRGEDCAFRFGGDEFAILFAETPPEGARAAVQRLEGAIHADPECAGVGVSWGVAALEDGDPAALLATADAVLYEVKRARAR
jgi:diguanylate cyclase (GGDEF)-like protein